MKNIHPQQPFFWVAVVFAGLFFGFLYTSVVLGWVNPTANPPTGGGAISVDGDRVRVGSGITTFPKLFTIASASLSTDVAISNSGSGGKTWSLRAPRTGATYPAGSLSIADEGSDVISSADDILRIVIQTSSTVPVASGIVSVVGDVRTLDTYGQTYERVWGKPRHEPDNFTAAIGVINLAGECTRSVDGNALKISRSQQSASWEGAAASCPYGWWVCTDHERGTTDCGTGNGFLDGMDCNVNNPSNSCYGWTSSYGDTGNQATAIKVRSAATGCQLVSEGSGNMAIGSPKCSIRRVWCCAYQ